MRQIFDEVRKKWVAATPEEIVRQSWLQKMVSCLGYPRSLLAVEKQLASLPGRVMPPKRRADIVCYRSDMTPLLLIECKADDLSQEALNQVLGYNDYVGAKYVAVASHKAILLRYALSCPRCVIDRLPTYQELVN